MQTGWLDENRYGLKVTVDMPAAALRLAEFLWSLTQGVSEQVGGLVVQVKNALDAARINARDSALGVNKAAKDAASFGRYLRSVLSSLRDIDRQVMASESVEERLHFYFHDFVEQVLLRDYADIANDLASLPLPPPYLRNHPGHRGLGHGHDRARQRVFRSPSWQRRGGGRSGRP